MSSLTPPEDFNIRTLCVRDIYDTRVEEQHIREHLSAYGELESVMMVPTRACAYVTFSTRWAAEKAAKDLDDKLEINGIPLKVTWGRLKTPQSVAHQNQTVQPQPRSAYFATPEAGQVPRPPPVLHYVSVPLPPPGLGSRPSLPRRYCSGSFVDPSRADVVIPSHDERAVSRSENLVGRDGISAEELPREERSFRLPVGNPSMSREQVEPQTMVLGGSKRMLEEEMSPQEMRERVMKKRKTSTLVGNTSMPPVSPQPPGLAQVGSAAEGESSEETPLTRFVTSFPRDFLLEKSTLWPDADTLLFPGPMHLLEKKTDIEIVEGTTEMALQVVQGVLMSRRRLLAQLGQQHVWRSRMAEAEAAEARTSSQMREAAAEIQSLKDAKAAAEARAAAAEARVAEAEAWAAAAVEARKAHQALLMTADAQLREMKEKMRLKAEEIREERKDAASTAGLRARAKLMREFLDGKSPSWDPQAEIDFYLTHIGKEADLVSMDTNVVRK